MTRSHSFVGHAKLVGGLTFLSRLLGLVRDAVLAACFGMSTVTDAFWIGFVVPNLFRRLFGEGALTAAFIPVYSQLVQRDRVQARRFAWACVAMLLALLAGVTLVGEFFLLWMLRYQYGDEASSLAIRLTMLMLPYMPMICTVALLGGILQVHHRFGPAASAPVVLNVVMIASALIAVFWYGSGDQPRAGIWYIAGGVVIAGVIQLLWVGGAALPEVSLGSSFSGTSKALRSVAVTMAPMALGLAIFQINTLLDSLIAWGLSADTENESTFVFWGRHFTYPIQSGAVTALQFAQRLYQFPLGVFGVAVATAIFPALSRAAASTRATTRTQRASDGDNPSQDAFGAILQQGLRLTVFIGLPASVGLILVRVPLARLMFERNQFTMQDSIRVAVILAGYASAVWAYSMTHVVTRAFHAVRDARTPLRISLGMVGANFVMNLTLVWHLGAAGLAWSTAICAMGQVTVLLLAVRRYVPQPINTQVWTSWGRSVLLTIVMAVMLWPIGKAYDPTQLSHWGCTGLLGGMVFLGVVIVTLGAKITRADELTWLIKRNMD